MRLAWQKRYKFSPTAAAIITTSSARSCFARPMKPTESDRARQRLSLHSCPLSKRCTRLDLAGTPPPALPEQGVHPRTLAALAIPSGCSGRARQRSSLRSCPLSKRCTRLDLAGTPPPALPEQGVHPRTLAALAIPSGCSGRARQRSSLRSCPLSKRCTRLDLAGTPPPALPEQGVHPRTLAALAIPSGCSGRARQRSSLRSCPLSKRCTRLDLAGTPPPALPEQGVHPRTLAALAIPSGCSGRARQRSSLRSCLLSKRCTRLDFAETQSLVLPEQGVHPRTLAALAIPS